MTPAAGGRDGSVAYGAEVDASRPATDYTPRVTGFHPDMSIPLEAAFIAWQK
ncbi:hypothetical protein [Komagataeibacter intermedius]